MTERDKLVEAIKRDRYILGKVSEEHIVDHIVISSGWHPPTPSRLRAVEKCPACLDGRTWPDGSGTSAKDCKECHGIGTITRPLTPEEMVEVAERPFFTNTSLLLKSGVRVILKEKDDAG